MPIVFCGPGDLLKTRMSVIVIPVNTEGVMGAGFAFWYKQLFYSKFLQYRDQCKAGRFKVGTLLLQRLTESRSALLFPTKTVWRQPSMLSYIETGLKKFVEHYEEKGIQSIAFPALGCGKGQLTFEDIKPLLYKYLDPLPIEIEVYSCRR